MFHTVYIDQLLACIFLGKMASSTFRSVTFPKVILFGDSISQRAFTSDGCWGSLLADNLQRKCDVLSRGFSGYNSRMCKALLPNIVDSFGPAKHVACVTIFLGANDANWFQQNPQQHVPLDEYSKNLQWMVEFLEVSFSCLFCDPTSAPPWNRRCLYLNIIN